MHVVSHEASKAAGSTMSRQSRVATAAVALTLGVVVFLGFGHGIRPDPMSGDHGSGHTAAALCLVLFIVLVPVTMGLAQLLRRTSRCSTLQRDADRTSLAQSTPLSSQRARASPVWLQCFRN